ncbi:hypothetical protein [Microcoleus sp. A6-D1]|uniref:hypothetical protein n=1 Tax=Microcoleus sp. A6-D1 TaxID=2818549 RepID=UPI002FD44ECC
MRITEVTISKNSRSLIRRKKEEGRREEGNKTYTGIFLAIRILRLIRWIYLLF